MSPVKKVSSDNLSSEYVFDEADSDALWAEWAALVESDDFLPGIVDVLGSFSEQIGAQFG